MGRRARVRRGELVRRRPIDRMTAVALTLHRRAVRARQHHARALVLRIDQPAFDATTFSKNRKRLLDAEVADEFFAAVVRQAKLRRYMSSEHFSVDGTLLKAWASHKSFKPKDGPPSDPPAGRNTEVQWHGEQRRNDTHASTTDPEARLYRKSNNTAATLCFSGHLLMEHRNALIVDAELTFADGYAERSTALEMLARLPKMARRFTSLARRPGPRCGPGCGS